MSIFQKLLAAASVKPLEPTGLTFAGKDHVKKSGGYGAYHSADIDIGDESENRWIVAIGHLYTGSAADITTIYFRDENNNYTLATVAAVKRYGYSSVAIAYARVPVGAQCRVVMRHKNPTTLYDPYYGVGFWRLISNAADPLISAAGFNPGNWYLSGVPADSAVIGGCTQASTSQTPGGDLIMDYGESFSGDIKRLYGYSTPMSVNGQQYLGTNGAMCLASFKYED